MNHESIAGAFHAGKPWRTLWALYRSQRRDLVIGAVSEAGQRLDRHNALLGAVAWVLMMLVQLAVLVAGGWLAIRGKLGLTAGDVVLLSGFTASIVASVSQLNAMLPIVTRGFDALRSIGEVLERPELEDNEGKPALGPVRGGFRFEHVHFEYPGDPADSRTQVATLTDLSLDIAPGGSGKSTLMNLVIGFYRPRASCGSTATT